MILRIKGLSPSVILSSSSPLIHRKLILKKRGDRATAAERIQNVN